MLQKVKPNRKSQSALEYMMTYGWAILIIVIVAGVLYSLGIFTPSSSASPTVTGFNGLGSPNAMCMSDGGLRLQLGNSLGYTINVTKINVTSNSVTQTIRPNQTISPDGTYIFYVPNVCGSASGAKYSFTSSVTYTEPGQPIFGPFYSNGAASGTVSSLVNPGYVLYVNNLAHTEWGWGGSDWISNGGNSYLTASTPISGGTNYTITMWVLGNFTAGTSTTPTPNSSSYVIDNHVSLFGLSSYQTLSMFQGGQPFVHECNSGDTPFSLFNPLKNVFDQRWHFVAMSVHNPVSSIIKDSNYYIQVDGYSDIANNSNHHGSTPLYIGAARPGGCDEGPFTGYITNVQIYAQTLSPSQINQIYNAGLLGAPINGVTLSAYYPLNGTIGRWVKDYSGNNYNGTLVNASITSNYPVEQIGG